MTLLAWLLIGWLYFIGVAAVAGLSVLAGAKVTVLRSLLWPIVWTIGLLAQIVNPRHVEVSRRVVR